MRASYGASLLLASVASVLGAAAPEDIEFPAAPVTPAPPAASVKLPAGTVYDIRCKVPCVVRAYPAELVTIGKEEVPAGETLRVRDEFFDGAKSHVYKGPLAVYSVRAAGKGTVQVVVTPIGFKHENEIKTVTLVVDGTGPQPPPQPPGPQPPDPPQPGPVTSFRVVFVWESGSTLTAAENSVINGAEVAKFLDEKTTKTDNWKGWRLKDKDAPTTGDTATFNALWGAIKPKVTAVPCVAIEVNGKVEIVPLGKTPAEMVATFKKYLGEK